jgi:hypothetical protein
MTTTLARTLGVGFMVNFLLNDVWPINFVEQLGLTAEVPSHKLS